MSKHLLILGAGVDRTTGIDFPLANTLLADVTRYLDGPGKDVEAALREMLPGLRFSFNSMIARAVDKIATREPHEQKAMVQRVQEAIAHLGEDQADIRKHGDLIIRLFNKLATIALESQLDADTEALIREVFPKDADDLIDSDSILDIHKLSLSDTFKTVLKRTLKLGLSSERHEVAAALGSDMLNIETLLIEKFLGFYNDKPADIKNYLYIAWALWAYLVAKQKEVLDTHEGKPMPFYSGVPSDLRAITLNYTAFLEQSLGTDQTIYFHGGLSDYVRMDTRDLLPVDDILNWLRRFGDAIEIRGIAHIGGGVVPSVSLALLDGDGFPVCIAREDVGITAFKELGSDGAVHKFLNFGGGGPNVLQVDGLSVRSYAERLVR